jgi:hypothetical protein
VRVPDVRIVDLESGIIAMEWIDGHTVRSILGDSEDPVEIPESGTDPFDQYGITQGKKQHYPLLLALDH